jgi:heat shock protein HtpX
MLLTMFLLGLLYVALIGALIASGAGGVTIAVVAVVLFSFQLFASDKLALATMGARVVTPQEQPELHAVIERLCIQADLPKPRVAVMDVNMPNAFATGRSQKSATICATTGLLRMLEPAELEGVIGHELSHVINRDVMVMTIASFFAMVSAVIIRFAFFFGMFGGGGFGGGGRGRGGGQNEEEAVLVVILVSVVVYTISCCCGRCRATASSRPITDRRS